jgi:hypothetical protein
VSERVTILERDQIPTEPVSRRGVPQGRHTHGLLAGGRLALEMLLPGFTDDLIREGAVHDDLTSGVGWFIEGAYHRRYASGLNRNWHLETSSRGVHPVQS